MKKHHKLNLVKWLLILLAIFFVLFILLVSSYIFFEVKYKSKIYPGVFVGNTNLSGLSLAQANNILNQKVDSIKQNGIVFHYHNNQATLTPLVSSVEGDLAYQIISFNIDRNLEQAFLFGRNKNNFENFKNKFNALVNKKQFPVLTAINTEEINNFLIENFSNFETPAENAKLEYNPNSSSNFSIIKERYGQRLDYDKSLLQLKNNLSHLNNTQIELSAIIDYPKIYEKDCINIDSQTNSLLSNTPFELTYDKNKWIISKLVLASWLTLKIDSNKTVSVGLNNESVSNYLQESISPKINIEPINAKFEIKDNKVVEFQTSKDGLEIDLEESIKHIEKSLLGNEKKISLITKDLKSVINSEDTNDLGIKEILGIGHSNFSHSSKNRIHNISVGAKSLNGLLIKPDEEFSTIGALGEINAEAGYVPELVIKENKTIPEFGGGLCQIGTTVFRAALDSGLPITMRRNHSYRVSYYEPPPGMDATIYDPWPDLKFINDTGHYILIQTRIVDYDIYFDFWGTSDGRVATTTNPVLTNIIKPGPTKLIETLDLAPGEKKCTEHAHNGADVYFNYIVTFPEQEPKEKTFYSHYVPWREVCLIGVEKLSENKTASSTSLIKN